ncbi:hypothetical protein L2E82_35933 [Cichorium intybus]|uniref:Uncharacterized protein n=1 Tax=Cichorium intybus TaxID=13427 RepID=A0ACB9BQB6_CICIN|nr:hypothetical protein L2E82_35933 [Cichorium intybus]
MQKRTSLDGALAIETINSEYRYEDRTLENEKKKVCEVNHFTLAENGEEGLIEDDDRVNKHMVEEVEHYAADSTNTTGENPCNPTSINDLLQDGTSDQTSCKATSNNDMEEDVMVEEVEHVYVEESLTGKTTFSSGQNPCKLPNITVEEVEDDPNISVEDEANSDSKSSFPTDHLKDDRDND